MTRETSEILPLAQTFQFNCDKNILKTPYFCRVQGRKQTLYWEAARDKSLL